MSPVAKIRGACWLVFTSGLVLHITMPPLLARGQGPASLVKDINVKEIYSAETSYPGGLTSFDGQVFFSVSDLHAGPGLWRSDGTLLGTERVTPGNFAWSLTANDAALFYYVALPNGQPELMRMDRTGTTVNLKTVASTPYFNQFPVVGGTVFFLDTGELWKTDGTLAGTVQVTQQPFEFYSVAAVRDTLVIAPGPELWKSDGSAAGTVRFKSFPGSLWAPEELTDVDGMLFFSHRDEDGSGLWRSDLTESGTARIVTFDSGAPSALTNVNGMLFFETSSGREIWRSDGTVGGTVRLADFVDGRVICVGGAYRCDLAAVDDAVFFGADDGTGVGLWRSDGTPAGTRLIRHVGISPRVPGMNIGGTLYFTASDDSTGVELWRSDGTEAGTGLVKDIRPGPATSLPSSLTDVDGTLFFWADDGDSGYEIWKSDGTEAGTVRVADLLRDTPGSNPTLLTDVNGTLLFVADDGHAGAELWRSDGTDAGTRLVRNINPVGGAFHLDLAPSRPTAVGDTLFFTADDGNSGPELWRSDGSENGTVLVKDINPSAVGSNPFAAGSHPFDLTEAGGTLFFWADDGSHGFELWKSDGTAAGTSLVRDINPGSFSSVRFVFCTPEASGAVFGGAALIGDPEGGGPAGPCGAAPTDVNGTLFFRADDGSTGFELWKTDGTAEGTMRVADIVQGGTGSDPAQLTEMSGALFFTAAGALWRSDGTEAGTVRIADIAASNLMDVDGTLFFVSAGETPGLWRSDGTAAGTLRVQETGPDLATISQLTNLEGTLLFIGSDASGMTQFWRSDGTEAGTVAVKQLPQGLPLSSPLTSVNDRLLFALGGEIWESDGTEAGTVAIQDLGPLAVPPSSFTRAGGRVFFSADAGGTGPELWALPLPTSCRGDCSGDGVVTINDLITAVNIALDRSLPSACQSLDTNDDGSLTVDEIITAVNEALYGCEWPDGHGRSAGGRSTRPNQGLVQVRPGLGAQRR